jgi:hypothetical protein
MEEAINEKVILYLEILQTEFFFSAQTLKVLVSAQQEQTSDITTLHENCKFCATS